MGNEYRGYSISWNFQDGLWFVVAEGRDRRFIYSSLDLTATIKVIILEIDLHLARPREG